MQLTLLTHDVFNEKYAEEGKTNLLLFNNDDKNDDNGKNAQLPHLYAKKENQLVLKIINGSNKDMIIKRADSIQSAPILIGIFDGILNDSELKALVPSLENFETQLITVEGANYIAINPLNKITIACGKPSSITFNKIKVEEKPNLKNFLGDLQLLVFYEGGDGAGSAKGTTTKIQLIRETKEPILPISLYLWPNSSIGKPANQVYITNDKNNYNIPPNELLLGICLQENATEPTALNAKFCISFITATESTYDALYSTNNDVHISIKKSPAGVKDWKPDLQLGKRKVLSLTPPSTGPILRSSNIDSLKTIRDNSLEVKISDIVTDFEAGFSLMYISWNNIDGYRDGSCAVPLEKVMPSAAVKNLEITNKDPIVAYLSPITFNYIAYGAEKWLLDIRTKEENAVATPIDPIIIDIKKNKNAIEIPAKDLQLVPGNYKIRLLSK